MSIVVNKTRLPVTEWKTEKASVVSVNDARMRAAKEVVVDINPVQDLHGYDSPWVGGGGVNLLDPTQVTLYGTGAYGLTTSWDATTGAVTLSGTWTGSSSGGQWRLLNVPSSVRGYNVMGFSNSNNFSKFRWQADADMIVVETKNMVKDQSYTIVAYPIVYSGTAPTSWSPYENICPITGWTGCNTFQSGKNLTPYNDLNFSHRIWGTTWSNQLARIKSLKAGTYTVSCKYTLLTNPNNESTVSAGMLLRWQGSDGWHQLIPYVLGTVPATVGAVYECVKTFTLTENDLGQNLQFYLYYGTGTTATTANCYDFKIEYGSSVTPFSEYQGSEYQVTFPVVGKNLLAPYTERSSHTGINYDVSPDGRIHVYGTATGSSFSGSNMSYEGAPWHLKAGTYTFSSSGMSATGGAQGYLSIGIRLSDGTLTQYSVRNSSQTFTVAEDFHMFYWIYVQNGREVNEYVSIQLELGQSASQYEPYTKTVYDGSFDFVSGDLTIDRKLVFVDGSSIKVEGIYANGTGYTGTIADMYNDSSYAHQREVMVISDKLKGSPFISIGSVPYGIAQNGGARLVFNIPNKSTKEDFNNWLSVSKPMALYYLAEPLTFHLTPAQIEMLERNNNIWSDTGETQVTYAAIRS